MRWCSVAGDRIGALPAADKMAAYIAVERSDIYLAQLGEKHV